MEILAIIPARGGSKGIPRKNLAILAGQPLIAYTIRAARNAKLLNRVVVSTEDEEIAGVAKSHGAEVILRPSELALDTTPTEPVLLDVLKTLESKEGYVPDAVVLLQPTSPLRSESHIDEAIKKLYDTEADAVVSVCEAQHHNLSANLDADRLWQPPSRRG